MSQAATGASSGGGEGARERLMRPGVWDGLYPRLMRVGLRAARRRHEVVEDAIHDVALRLLGSRSRYDPSRDLFPYLASSVFNAVKTEMRKRKPLTNSEPAAFDHLPADDAGDPARRAAHAELLTRVTDVVRGLDRFHRTVLRMRYWEALTQKQIADVLEVSQTSVQRACVAALLRVGAGLPKPE